MRLAVLRAVFPGLEVSIKGARKIDDSWPEKPTSGELFFPDALVNEPVDLVIGRAVNEVERTASENLDTEQFSNARQVRMKLYQWPKSNPPGLLAVIQYDFAAANPALSCPSVGLLVHLVRNAASWETRNRYLLETTHHSAIQRVELLDVTGEGTDELIIESNFGGAGTAGSTLQVFDLSRGHFDELLNTNSRLEYADQEGYTQLLDVKRTIQNRGELFCVVKTTLFENGKWFDSPRVARPCYKRGYGVDSREVRGRQGMLAPLR